MNGFLMGMVAGGFVLVVGLFVVVKFVLPRVLAGAATKFALSLFEAKASALRQANLEVLEIGPTEARATGPGRWVRMRLRLTPRAGEQPGFTMWEPTELALFPASQVAGEQLSVEQVEQSISPFEVRLLEWDRSQVPPPEEGEQADETPDKIVGPGEIELIANVPEEVRQVRLHYYHVLVGPVLELSA
ncbi:MAG: hypothetical protein AMXMBFR33_08120 [Candidatus Xenobia bacterium]|jgi:hypothetical protein